MQKKFLEAGKIVGTHGVQGELRVQSWCDNGETLCQFDTLYFDEHTPIKVRRAAVHKNVVLMRLEGVDTMEAAEALKNRLLYLNRDDVELPDDLVFIQDILGFAVYDLRTGQTVGTVQDVLTSNPAYDMYEIEGQDGKLVYLPAAKPFLKEIDMEAGVIRVETIEGLLE